MHLMHPTWYLLFFLLNQCSKSRNTRLCSEWDKYGQPFWYLRTFRKRRSRPVILFNCYFAILRQYAYNWSPSCAMPRLPIHFSERDCQTVAEAEKLSSSVDASNPVSESPVPGSSSSSTETPTQANDDAATSHTANLFHIQTNYQQCMWRLRIV